MAESPPRITAFYSGLEGARGYWRPDPDSLSMPDDAIMPTLYVRGDIANRHKSDRDMLLNHLKTALQYVIKWTTSQGSPSQWREPGGALYDLYIAPIETAIKDSEKNDV